MQNNNPNCKNNYIKPEIKKGNHVIFRISTNHHTQAKCGRVGQWLAETGATVERETNRQWRSFVWGKQSVVEA